MNKTLPSFLVIGLLLAAAPAAAAEKKTVPISPGAASPGTVTGAAVPLLPKVFSTIPAGVLVLDMGTWQSPFGWPFTICANAQVNPGWDGLVFHDGVKYNRLMVWPDGGYEDAPACPEGQFRIKYWVVLDGQPAPGDYTVRLGRQLPGVVAVPLVLRVPGGVYQQRILKAPIRPR